MVAICFYFQIHQPFRIQPYRIKQVGTHDEYFNDELNKSVFLKVAQKCYYPSAYLFLSLLKRYPDKFRMSFSVTSTFIEQCEHYDPKLLSLYVDLLSHPNVEILSETSHHSLAALVCDEEFFMQVQEHKNTIQKYFGKTPTAFRNTELIYSNEIGKKIYQAGFEYCLLEGWEPVLPYGFNAHHVFYHPDIPNLKLLPKSYKLSDDIAFRFSNRSWKDWPLTATKYHSWLDSLLDGNHEFIGLFMDYETFGEHQWSDTGIFEFMEHFISNMSHDHRFEFLNVTEVGKKFKPHSAMSVHHPLSWADTERDITAWRGNKIQEDALKQVYSLRNSIYELNDVSTTTAWRKLLTSDHFYYMCIKWNEDGDVHKYFSPFDSPYEAYINYMNIIEDLGIKCQKLKEKKFAPEYLV